MAGRYSTSCEFTDTTLDGTYGEVSPPDEYRTLTKTVDGWELAELDGMVHAYDSLGRWESTTDRHGNAKPATYDASGFLDRVDFPDGSHETFGYNGANRLTSIREVGIDGLTDLIPLFRLGHDERLGQKKQHRSDLLVNCRFDIERSEAAPTQSCSRR